MCVCVQSSAFRPDSLQRRLKAASGVAARLQGLVVPVNDTARAFIVKLSEKTGLKEHRRNKRPQNIHGYLPFKSPECKIWLDL